jgi:hypothetical protein
MVWSMIAVVCGCSVFFWFMVYDGRKARRDIHVEQG